MIVPAAAQARAVASSPSGVSSVCSAVGATRIGIDTRVPRSSVSAETAATSVSTRGRSCQREKAAVFARSVTSSPAPPAK